MRAASFRTWYARTANESVLVHVLFSSQQFSHGLGHFQTLDSSARHSAALRQQPLHPAHRPTIVNSATDRQTAPTMTGSPIQPPHEVRTKRLIRRYGSQSVSPSMSSFHGSRFPRNSVTTRHWNASRNWPKASSWRVSSTFGGYGNRTGCSSGQSICVLSTALSQVVRSATGFVRTEQVEDSHKSL